MEQLLITLPVLVFSIVLHEVAHGWVARREGDPTAAMLGRITLNPIPHIDPIGSILVPALLLLTSSGFIFGWAKPVPVNIGRLRRQRRDYVLVAAAGPASNLLLALGASVGLSLLTVSPMTLDEPNVSAPIAALLGQALRLNVLLAVFNMLPIPPLDGGNVLGGLLPHAIEARYDALIRPYGFLLLYALMFTRGFDYLVIAPARFLLSWL